MPIVIRDTGIDDIHRVASQYRYLTGQEPVLITAVTLTSISPNTKVAGAAQFTLTATGTGFISGRSQIVWGADIVPTTFVSATSMTAVIDAAKVATAGEIQVGVITNGVTTPTFPFTITATSELEADAEDLPTDNWLKADIISWLIAHGTPKSDSEMNNLTKAELIDHAAELSTPAA